MIIDLQALVDTLTYPVNLMRNRSRAKVLSGPRKKPLTTIARFPREVPTRSKKLQTIATFLSGSSKGINSCQSTSTPV